MTHDPNDPTILKAALCEAIDRADAAERQLHEARTQVERLEEELKRSYKRNDEVLDRALRAERLAGDLRADVEEAKHEADIRLDNERRSWTQLKRCQEALENIQGDCYLWQIGDWIEIDADALVEHVRKEARSALSQQSVPNTRETK